MKSISLVWKGPDIGGIDKFALEYVPGGVPHPDQGWMWALDPGRTTGWACVVEARGRIVLGEAPMHDVMDAVKLTSRSTWLVVEVPPHGVVRAFDPEVYYAFGILRYMRPDLIGHGLDCLKPARAWHRIKGLGVSPHAKDALAHLLYQLVLDTQGGRA